MIFTIKVPRGVKVVQPRRLVPNSGMLVCMIRSKNSGFHLAAFSSTEAGLQFPLQTPTGFPTDIIVGKIKSRQLKIRRISTSWEHAARHSNLITLILVSHSGHVVTMFESYVSDSPES